ncbi:phosphoadenylyl-sulfate reductase [Dyadobacter chenwenxiniae]|uniref:Adenosine 5'-phosphosulfate reductase n=1 Tax=Dyadobacter chenwenxiniae TaxID=2906456 RepID=A0A9X1PLJ9_9BACT|nr:phosphoadenylyl-sulfate reductase [Dyadobacter chenwenxiniae]MCF0063542.1 phosphoadenylyl-sulfate reductase [Dyadobacter chenwenxiniae]UON83220.1 phosphoadenylyl-sulfate reductase [Dyadobacter chenwenxiniae]
MNNTTSSSLNAAIEGKSETESLAILADLFPGEVVFSTSLGYEDQVITDFILKNNLNITIFTLDTGRLFSETYMTLQKTNNRYDTKIKVYYPQTDSVETLVSTKGPLSFYDSVENRKECCFIRKVEPLNRALKGAKIWVTGIRAEQSGNRHDMPQLEWDEAHQLVKFHPILHWSFEEVKGYVKSNGIPYNPLHDKGFVSIGCAPCTRAIQEGEDFRAGRWWWEDESKKECGLHAK